MIPADELIEELREGLAARSADIELPDGLATRARHTAHRRRARRAAIAAVPVLLIAAAAGALATGALGSSGPTVDAAYARKQIVTHLVQARAGRTVGYEVDSIRPDHGSALSWSYTDPHTRVSDTYVQFVDRHGHTDEVMWWTSTVRGHTACVHTITVHPEQRTWTVADTKASSGAGASWRQVGATSTPAQIAHALSDGEVARAGRVTVGGQSAIRIHVPAPAIHAYSGYLYVSAKTHRPLKSFMSMRDGIQGGPPHRRYTFTASEYWLPATRSNIGLATRTPMIPAGYRKVK